MTSSLSSVSIPFALEGKGVLNLIPYIRYMTINYPWHTVLNGDITWNCIDQQLYSVKIDQRQLQYCGGFYSKCSLCSIVKSNSIRHVIGKVRSLRWDAAKFHWNRSNGQLSVRTNNCAWERTFILGNEYLPARTNDCLFPRTSNCLCKRIIIHGNEYLSVPTNNCPCEQILVCGDKYIVRCGSKIVRSHE